MFLLPKHDSFRILLLVSILIPYTAFSVSRSVAPIREGPEKLTSYESGMEPKGGAWIQFQIRYYMFAPVFVIPDVETVSPYPRAMSFRELGLFAFTEVSIPISILIVGSIYAW
nr:NADH-plastoquinone oxidoreductase subunit 3 [Dipteris conjugata]